MDRELADLHRGARAERQRLTPDAGPCVPPGETEPDDDPECPRCGSADVAEEPATAPNHVWDYGCRDCGIVWDDGAEW